MNVAQFIAKWERVELTESSAAQQRFLDLCEVVEHPKPAAADPKGESFTFERGATKHGGGDGCSQAYGWPADLSDEEILERPLRSTSNGRRKRARNRAVSESQVVTLPLVTNVSAETFLDRAGPMVSPRFRHPGELRPDPGLGCRWVV